MPDVADLSPEARGAIHEKRICELAARITLAVLGGVVPRSFSKTLQRHKGKIGQSYDKIMLELGDVEIPMERKSVDHMVMDEEIEILSQIEDA